MAENRTFRARIRQKIDTAANWAEADPVLEKGELAVVSDGGKLLLKAGDGEKNFSGLPFFTGADHTHGPGDLNGVLPVEKGGTGQAKADTAPASGSSAMVTSDGIFKALSGKADPPRTVTATLTAGGWSAGEEAPHTQELSVSGLGADQNGAAGLAQSATQEQRKAARLAGLGILSQAAGVLTIAADGEVPETDIPLQIMLF